MKRYLALFLSLVMILCALPLAIAEDVENPYEDDGIVIYRDADGNVIDLGGMEITVCDWWSSDWHDDEPTTAAGEATYDYRTWLEETYNFKIVQRNATTWNDSPSDFTNFATTGGDENYVWILRAGAYLAPFKAGLFYGPVHAGLPRLLRREVERHGYRSAEQGRRHLRYAPRKG